MAKVVSFVGKELKEPMTFITEGGTYRMKIIKHEVDGYTQEGNEKNKYSFECNKVIAKDGKPALSDDKYSHNETYSEDTKSEWVFHYFVDALKISTAFKPEDLVGRYIMSDIVMNVSTSNGKSYANCSPYGYKYSKANDELPPIVAPAEAPSLDIDEDEMPF